MPRATDIEVRALLPGDAAACDAVIRSLPYHFGDPGGRAQCAAAVRSQRGLVAVGGDSVSGFLTWRPWFGASCEITWIAVCQTRRARGIGTLLLEHLAGLAIREGLGVLLVTTLSDTVAEPAVADGYARTRAFYESRGFAPVWEPQGWWSDDNQAVLMLRVLTGAR
jgi:GNAT superfamily N-acetyltransferase